MNLVLGLQKIITGFIILLMIAFFVTAGDVIVESGKIDVDSKLFINDAGNVGIGTTNPLSKLQVEGTFNASDNSGAGIITDNTGNVIIQLG